MAESGIFNLRDVQMLATEHDVTVLHLIAPRLVDSNEPVESSCEGPIRVIRVPFTLANPRLWFAASATIRREARASDLLHTMALPALLPAKQAAVGLPWVHTEHYSALVAPSLSVGMKLPLAFLSRLLKYPDEVVAVSEALAHVIDKFRLAPSTVIGNEVMDPVAEVVGEHDFTGRLRLIGVGGLIERKGPLVALDTLCELLARGVDAELVWVGEGELRHEMLSRAEMRGIADRLTLTGRLEPQRLSRELLRADIFLLPVETETFGVAIAEALAHGLPVIATGVGGHESFLPEQGSRLLKMRNGRELADALQELIADPALATRGEIAALAEARFAAQNRVAAYRQVYDSARGIQR